MKYKLAENNWRMGEPSPSARRAWIEIKGVGNAGLTTGVALRTEGVD